MSWRCAAKSDGAFDFWPHAVATSPARIRYCANLRTRKNNSRDAAVKAALCVCREFLARRRYGVHVTQAISECLHHMCRTMRHLLNQKMEPPSIDLRQSAGCLRHRVGRARSVVDQCHLTDQCAWPCGLQHKIAQGNVDFSF